MVDWFKYFAAQIALLLEVIAVVVIAVGTVVAVAGLLRPKRARNALQPFGSQRFVWVRFGVVLLLGLEFELAADIVRTAISPTWNEIGELAAIAVIRTFLNYFLAKDVEGTDVANLA